MKDEIIEEEDNRRDMRIKKDSEHLRRGISSFESFTLCFSNAAIIPSIFI